MSLSAASQEKAMSAYSVDADNKDRGSYHSVSMYLCL